MNNSAQNQEISGKIYLHGFRTVIGLINFRLTPPENKFRPQY